jgi:hypothetical protein
MISQFKADNILEFKKVYKDIYIYLSIKAMWYITYWSNGKNKFIYGKKSVSLTYVRQRHNFILCILDLLIIITYFLTKYLFYI